MVSYQIQALHKKVLQYSVYSARSFANPRKLHHGEMIALNEQT